MPEGPEVRRYALMLAEALEGQEIIGFTARNKDAKQWLLERHSEIIGRNILKVRSHGKHLFGCIEGGYGFQSHLMMWGRWYVHPGTETVEVDRRERARITTPKSIAILQSAPVFNLFQGDPYEVDEYLRTLGPDILPYDGNFNAEEFLRRLQSEENLNHEIGAVLLDQRIAAGIGNYLRAEILFFCKIDPWKRVGELSREELTCIAEQTPLLARRSLADPGLTVTDEMRHWLQSEPHLSYKGRNGDAISEYGTRHAVFRRTNLPCLVCGNLVRQARQRTYNSPDGDEDNERSRIMYFCPVCQGVVVEKAKRTSRLKAPPA